MFFIDFARKICTHRELISLHNFNKVISYLRQGELLTAMKRINKKIDVFDASISRKHRMLNDCLYKSERIDLIETIDIIVPIYNAYQYTEKCIASILKNTNSPYNLYLLDDGSSDERVGALLEKLEKTHQSQWLLKLYIIRNNKNLGFIGTANKGFEKSRNNVVILNTDTEVPLGWLQRLMKPIIENTDIATVTPFSNCATICSFPEFCKDNILPQGISLEEMDKLFSLYGSTSIIDIPTGIGFCMAISRKCLAKIGGFDTAYGKGYGEENDFCRRAAAAGYRNVMVTNLFVYHKHGASFGEIITKTKQERIDENLRILIGRYPDYQDVIDEYIALDPVQDIRKLMELIIERNIHKEQMAELAINHSLGGGATAYIKRRIQENQEKIYFVIELLQDGKTLQMKAYNLRRKFELYFDYSKADKSFLQRICKALIINHIFINQLVDYPINKIIQMILYTKIKYDFFVHDFYCVCPRYNLLNANNKYCRNEKSAYICNKCLQSNILCNAIEKWRAEFFLLLAKAESVITPSNNTTEIIKGYYPTLNIKTWEHSVPDHVRMTYNENFRNNKVLHVSVLGAIGEAKGARLIEELVSLIRKHKASIKITVIGYTDRFPDKYTSKDGVFTVTGPYNNAKVSELLAAYKSNIVLIPSIWPETYSYTVSEAIFSGYKVLAFNIGAPAERIKNTGMGWLIDEISSKALYESIEDIRRNMRL